MDKFKSITELKNAIGNKKIDESQITIVLDNDWTGFSIDGNRILQGEGYNDMEELYKLLFPKAIVEWC